MITLTADTTNGVLKGNLEGEVLSAQDFYDALSSLKDGQVISATVSDELADIINKEFGIH